MNHEIKAKWVAALRSGEYKQGQRYLRVDDTFCCLGVLCDLHAKATGGEWEGFAYFDAIEVPPAPVYEWAGIDDQRTGPGAPNNLAYANDHGKAFAEIADIIEREL